MWVSKEQYEKLKEENKSLQAKYEKTEAKLIDLEFDTNRHLDEISTLKSKCKVKDELLKKFEEELDDKVPACGIGPWCKDCKHYCVTGEEYELFHRLYLGDPHIVQIDTEYGKIYRYCKKWLHEQCPDWEEKK